MKWVRSNIWWSSYPIIHKKENLHSHGAGSSLIQKVHNACFIQFSFTCIHSRWLMWSMLSVISTSSRPQACHLPYFVKIMPSLQLVASSGINNHIDNGTRNSFCTVNRTNSGDVFSNQVYNHRTWYFIWPKTSLDKTVNSDLEFTFCLTVEMHVRSTNCE